MLRLHMFSQNATCEISLAGSLEVQPTRQYLCPQSLMCIILPSQAPSGFRCLVNFKHRCNSVEANAFYGADVVAFNFATPWDVAKTFVRAARQFAAQFAIGLTDVIVRRCIAHWQTAPINGFEVVLLATTEAVEVSRFVDHRKPSRFIC